MVCTQNATAGEEYRRGWHPEKFHPAANREKGVLVIGAGPAGMECAMVLGKRDFSAVHLVEAGSEIGGCVNWISKLGHSDGKENLFRGSARGLGEWQRIVNYRQIQLDKLRNVEVHLGSRLSVEQVLEYGAEIVIVATGCHFATDGLNAATHAPIEGADASLDWQLTPDQVVAGTKPIGKRVLVLENEAYFMGVSVAQKLAGEGHEVHARDAGRRHRALHGLHARGADAPPRPPSPRRQDPPADDAREDRARRVPRATTSGTPAHKERIEVDSVVLSTARISNDELYRELKADRGAARGGGRSRRCT